MYAAASKRPMYVLAFLLPLLIVYELGSHRYLVGEVGASMQPISACQMLADFFGWFGVTGLYLPGIALIAVLLTWHVCARHTWRVRPAVVLLMWVESIALALPLLVLSQLIARASAGDAALVGPGLTWAEYTWQQRLFVALGAGLYEELLFRMVTIGAILLIVVDLFRARPWLGNTIAVLFSAVLFAMYHHPHGDGGALDWLALSFYVASGLYLGSVFLLRGFGVVVAVHAVYDAVVLVVLPALTTGR